MVRLFQWLMLLTVVYVSLLVPTSEAATRVVVPSAPQVKTVNRSRAIRIGLSFYLRERLTECDDVIVVSKKRSKAILREIKIGVRSILNDNLRDAFSDYVPVDVVIEFQETEEEQWALKISSPDGVVKRKLAGSSGRKSVQDIVRRAAQIVGRVLELPKTQRNILLEKRISNPDVFRASYASRVLHARWPQNSGETRLRMLKSLFSENMDSPALAAAILNATRLLLNQKNRSQDFAKNALSLSRVAIRQVPGTRYESAAALLIPQRPKELGAELEPLLKALRGVDGMLEMDETAESESPGGLPGLDGMGEEKEEGGEVSLAAAAGALRVLAVVKSKAARQTALDVVDHEEKAVRHAVAEALAHYKGPEVDSALKLLLKDQDPVTALLAGRALGEEVMGADRLRDLAVRVIGTSENHEQEAAPTLARYAKRDDRELLEKLARSTYPEIRIAAVKGLMQIGGVDTHTIENWLEDPVMGVVMAVLNDFPADAGERLITAGQKLANSPYQPLAQSAREALMSFRPSAERERMMFDLQIEHPYLRKRIVDRLDESDESWAEDVLVDACDNPAPHVRTYAMEKLAKRAPSRAQNVLLRGIRDPYRWVRLHAAAILAGMADESAVPAIKKQLEDEPDRATRLYLRDALAHAGAAEPPPEQKSARSVEGRDVVTWLCGYGRDAPHSPFEAYYNLGVDVDERWKEAHRAGKIMFGRVGTVNQPGLIPLSQDWSDRFWLAIEWAVSQEDLSYIDGFVFGEESMKLSPRHLWDDGWRVFCREKGIDTGAIKGNHKNLSSKQAKEWRAWALKRSVEGFNAIYDYVHLRYGRLRPGIQVATFLPGQALHRTGPTPLDREWKFDVGGIYHYKAGNRNAAYNMVRRYRTLWPERPVIWLSLGIGGYEMNPVKRTKKVPDSLINTRQRRAWADTVSAYAAGADPGWFSIWIFVEKEWSGGMHDLEGEVVQVEDIGRNSPVLKDAIEYAWKGAKKDYAPKVKAPEADEKGLLGPEENDDMDDLGLVEDDAEKKKEKIREKIEREKQRFLRGFCIYQKYVYDCARVFQGLPRMTPHPDILSIRAGVSVWTRPGSPNPLVPGQALPATYDFVSDLNKCATLDLSGYKLIFVRDHGVVEEKTVDAISEWLQREKGLLYVHGHLPGSDVQERASQWPWAGEVVAEKTSKAMKKPEERVFEGKDDTLKVDSASVTSTYTTKGENTTVLLRSDGDPVLVLWRRQGGKGGAVLFDGVSRASRDYLQFLRRIINRLHTEYSCGRKLESPILHQVARRDEIVAAASTPYYRRVGERKNYAGLDLLTGASNPVVGGGRWGAVIAKNWTGTYAAMRNGIAVLSENPLEGIESDQNGVVIDSKGLTRVAASGGVEVSATETDSLPLIEEEDATSWILWGTEPGKVQMPEGNDKSEVVYYRFDGPVRVTKGQ